MFYPLFAAKNSEKYGDVRNSVVTNVFSKRYNMIVQMRTTYDFR